MASKEADAYLETAEEQLKDAELAFSKDRHALCVFLSASSAENATSALLITFGAKPSKKHRNSLVVNKLLTSFPTNLRPTLREIIESIKTLEPHITRARYPFVKGLKLLPPSKFYTNEIAQKALANARTVIDDVKELIRYGN